jgi:glyoxylate reductase
MPSPLITTSRPLPAEFAVPNARIQTGPDKGFPSTQAFAEFAKGSAAIVTWVSERIDAQMLDAIGPDLKIVANFAVGIDNIDTDACAKRNIWVTNTPDAVTEATADCAIMLMLAAARRLTHADNFARSGEWEQSGILGPADMIGMPLENKTLCLVGAGRIAKATARRALAWDMNLLYVARNPKPDFESAPLNAKRVTLEEGLKQADFVSLHTPLTDETHHLINADRLALMKPTAVLVNTARGPVVDEAALAHALAHKMIFGAGLDVFESEPKVNSALKPLDNVVITPHFGSANASSRAQMTRLCAQNVQAVLEGRDPPTPVVRATYT